MEEGVRSRPEVLESLLGSLGLAEENASALSADLVLRHPMARRVGVRRMARTLREQGMNPDTADSAANLLFALEGFDLGRSLQEIRSELRVAGEPDATSLGAVYEAARLHRASGRPEQAVPRTPPIATLAAVSLTAYTVLVSLWLLSGI